MQRACLDALEQGVGLASLTGEVLFLNRAGQAMTGYTAEELGALFRNGQWRSVRADGSPIPDEERPIRRTIATGEPVRGEIVGWQPKHGEPLLVRVSTEPVRDHEGRMTGVVVAFLDVTAEHAALQALHRSHARFAALVERSTDVICIIDGTGVLVYASPAGEHLLGHPTGTQHGRRFAELVHPDDIGDLSIAFAELLEDAGGDRTAEARIRDASGNWRHMEIVATNRIDDPAVGGVIANVRDVTERTEAAARISWQAFHDSLTGLANRTLLLDRIGQAIATGDRGLGRAAVLFVDLDGFKAVNDGHGHAAGDQLLVEVAARLRVVARDGDTVARVGGDEFVLLLAPVQWQPDAERVAGRVIDALSRPYDLPFGRVEVGASVGIAIDAGGDAPSLLRNADAALHRAKARGKGCWAVFDADLRAEAEARSAGAAALRRALVSDRLQVFLQPIVDLRIGEVAGGEAALDLADAEAGDHLGAELLAVAEDSGLIVPIGAGLIDGAADAAVVWRDRGGIGFVGIDVSIQQLRTGGFHGLLERVLARHDLEPFDLAIEIAATALADPDPLVVRNLDRTFESGVRILLVAPGAWPSIDPDRCSGVKLAAATADATFVRRCEADGLLVIAEGITSAAALDVARAAGCHLGQGPWLASPLPAERLPQRVGLDGPAPPA